MLLSQKRLKLSWIVDECKPMASGWNQFDFFLVGGTFTAIFEKTLGSQFLALRSFRCLRPLRAMKNFRDGQLLIRTAMQSLPLLRDALIFLGFFLLVAAVSGTTLFGGQLRGRCTTALVPAPSPLGTLGTAVSNATMTCPAAAGVSMDGHICDARGLGYRCDAAAGEACCDAAQVPMAGQCKLTPSNRH